MQIVIDIPEEIKKKRDAGKVLSSEEIATVCMAIKNGTPLPKGHGDLVDFDKICEEYWDGDYIEIHVDELAKIQPIIEADGGDAE